MRRILTSLATLTCLIFAFHYVRSVDWCRSYNALPPKKVDVINCTCVKIDSIELNSKNPQNLELSFAAGSKIDTKLLAETDTSQWKWGSFGLKKVDNDARKMQADLPALSFRMQFVRRSSIPPGEVVASTTVANAKRIDSKKIVCKNQCLAPTIPGMYRVRVSIGKSTGDVLAIECPYEILYSFDASVQDVIE